MIADIARFLMLALVVTAVAVAPARAAMTSEIAASQDQMSFVESADISSSPSHVAQGKHIGHSHQDSGSPTSIGTDSDGCNSDFAKAGSCCSYMCSAMSMAPEFVHTAYPELSGLFAAMADTASGKLSELLDRPPRV